MYNCHQASRKLSLLGTADNRVLVKQQRVARRMVFHPSVHSNYTICKIEQQDVIIV